MFKNYILIVYMIITYPEVPTKHEPVKTTQNLKNMTILSLIFSLLH